MFQPNGTQHYLNKTKYQNFILLKKNIKILNDFLQKSKNKNIKGK